MNVTWLFLINPFNFATDLPFFIDFVVFILLVGRDGSGGSRRRRWRRLGQWARVGEAADSGLVLQCQFRIHSVQCHLPGFAIILEQNRKIKLKVLEEKKAMRRRELTTAKFLQSSRSERRSVRLRWMMRWRRFRRVKSNMYWASWLSVSSSEIKRRSTM